MSDLVDECGKDLAQCGYESVKLNKYNITYSKLFIDSDEKGKKFGFDKGHYFIINAPLMMGLPDEHYKILKDEIKERIRFLFKENKIKKDSILLFVGIGNPDILSDSFGNGVINKINIKPFCDSNHIYKIAPNTFSNTGINAYEIIRLLVEAFDIKAVILFDALATTNLARLGTSIQFNDSGLTPGSALNKFGMPINKNTLNVPCISVGVPMMISAGDISKKYSKDLILSEKDVGEKVEYLSTLLADVFNDILK